MKTPKNSKVRNSDRFVLDNVRYEMDWDKFVPGSSVFIPTLRVDLVRQRLYDKGIVRPREIDTRVTIEDGVYGIRVWRLK